MRIYLLETKTFDFEALLNMIPNRPEPIGDGEVSKHPLHTQRFSAIAEYIIEKYDADIRAYAADTGTFDKRQLDIVDNWDYRKVKPLDLTQNERGLKVRDGRHRCIIIAVFVLTGQIAYQPVAGEITDFKKYVDTSDFSEFFHGWIPTFETDVDYQANLWVQFESDELHNQSLADTMQRYKALTQTLLRDIPEPTQKRILPLKIVGGCQSISKYSERVDIFRVKGVKTVDEQITEDQVRTALETLGVFVGDFDGTVYVKCNNLERAVRGYGRDDRDNLVSLKDFTERLNNEQAPE